MKRFQIEITNEHFTREVFVTGEGGKATVPEVVAELSECSKTDGVISLEDRGTGSVWCVPSEVLRISIIKVTEVTEQS